MCIVSEVAFCYRPRIARLVSKPNNMRTCHDVIRYLANDMQFFVIGILVLFVYVKSKPAAYGG